MAKKRKRSQSLSDAGWREIYLCSAGLGYQAVSVAASGQYAQKLPKVGRKFRISRCGFLCQELENDSQTGYYDALTMIRDDLPALELLDGDGNPRIPETPIRGYGFQRLRWRRYEIESYLVHPAVMERFIEEKMSEEGNTDDIPHRGASQSASPKQTLAPNTGFVVHRKQKARTYFQKQLPAVWDDPLGEHLILEGLKASTRIIPAILAAADIHGVEKRNFFQIAAMMRPEEIHPEVIEKLNAIQKAFRL